MMFLWIIPAIVVCLPGVSTNPVSSFNVSDIFSLQNEMTGQENLQVLLTGFVRRLSGPSLRRKNDVEIEKNLQKPVENGNIIMTNDVSIQTRPSSILPGVSKHLTVNCSCPVRNSSDLSDVMSLIIYRNTDQGKTYFSEIASLNTKDKENVKVKDGMAGAEVKGLISENGEAFISMKWTSPDDSTHGEYKCEAFGMDSSGHPRVSTDTTKVTAEQDVTIGVLLGELQELRSSHEALEDQFDNFKANMTTRLDGALLSFFSTSAVFGGHRYYLSKPSLRDIAKYDSICRLFGGYLVEIDSQAEYDFVWDFVVVKNKIIYLALGATDLGQEGVWKFLHSGKSVVFHKRGDGLTGGLTSNCMELWKEFSGFVDEPCYGYNNRKRLESNFLCEIEQ